jgi:hypothetical protein
VKPDSFAAVMATGIVSVAAVDHGYRVISDVLIVLAAVALPVLIVAAAIAWRRESWQLTNLDTSLRLCTYIAACAVVGARFAEHRVVLWVLAGMALQGWLSLAPVVAQRGSARSCRGSARSCVGGGVPARDVLVGHVCDGRRNRLALADDRVTGVLLDRVRRVDHRGDWIARRISAITRCGCSVRSSQVNRNTFQPFSEILFCRVRSC